MQRVHFFCIHISILCILLKSAYFSVAKLACKTSGLLHPRDTRWAQALSASQGLSIKRLVLHYHRDFSQNGFSGLTRVLWHVSSASRLCSQSLLQSPLVPWWEGGEGRISQFVFSSWRPSEHVTQKSEKEKLIPTENLLLLLLFHHSGSFNNHAVKERRGERDGFPLLLPAEDRDKRKKQQLVKCHRGRAGTESQDPVAYIGLSVRAKRWEQTWVRFYRHENGYVTRSMHREWKGDFSIKPSAFSCRQNQFQNLITCWHISECRLF